MPVHVVPGEVCSSPLGLACEPRVLPEGGIRIRIPQIHTISEDCRIYWVRAIPESVICITVEGAPVAGL